MLGSDADFTSWTVAPMMQFLKDRGVEVESTARKADLVEQCSAASILGLPLDPDFVESDQQILKAVMRKLHLITGKMYFLQGHIDLCRSILS